MAELFQNWKPLLYNLGIIIGAGIIGLIVHFIAFRIMGRVYRKTATVLDDSIMKHARRPSGYLMVLLAINIAMPVVQLPESVLYVFNAIFRSLFIISVSWLAISMMAVAEDMILRRHNINAKDNLQARKIYT